jgi:putative inorganic carbon (hco3(-)) transporter
LITKKKIADFLKTGTAKLILFYIVSALFLLVNAWFLVKKDSLALNLLPLLLVLLLIVIFSLDKLIYLVVLLVPVSLPLHEFTKGLSFDMFLPTEPLLFGILVVFLIKSLATRNFDKKILLHPVSLAIFAYLFWILLTCFASTMPVVSFKFLLSRIWFIVAFYLLLIKIFEGGKNIEKFVWLYIISFIVVILYSTFRHLGYGLWDKQAAHFVVDPFFNDHTAYGGALAMYIPFGFAFLLMKKRSVLFRWGAAISFGLLFMGLILSYCRAAWLSLIAGIAVWLVIIFKIRFRTILIASVLLAGLIISFQTRLVMMLERNTVQSSANLTEHISSISNISSDASNLERLNRWSCAIRMFKDKPLFGFGPGTYMFKYAGYQLKKDRTIISTNSADRGNAHSEYLGPLAETGFPGLISILFLIGIVIYTAVKTYGRLKDTRLKNLILASLIGLVTYYVHGIMNNFLDTDKASAPFWGFTAIIVTLDIYSRQYIPPIDLKDVKSLEENKL